MKKHILVTGGAGFIGSHLVDRLLSEGWQVTVVDNFNPFYDVAIKEANVKPHLENPHCRLLRADIRDWETLKLELKEDYDVIIHLAARAGVCPTIQDPLSYREVNVQGTQNMLELAKERGIKQFILAYSSSVYGTNPRLPWREDDCVLLPISPYAATKVAGELLGHVYSHLWGIRFIALRFFTVYGPRQRPDLAICKFARLMLEGKPIPIYGDGSSSRDYTYIDDVIQGVRAAIDYTATSYEIINLGNNHTMSLMEMVHALEGALGVRAKLEFLPPQPGDVAKTWADIEKAKRILDYVPSTFFNVGIEQFAKWIKQG